MQFLNPLWLFAIAAISIPVVIHLWNIKLGKTLKVGSIALITSAAQKSSRSFKLNDIPLFILRCLFLLILSFLLAAPFWRHDQTTTPAKGWVLIPKENFKETCKNLKLVIDSLSKKGYEFHFFDEKLQKIELNKTLIDSLLKDSHKVKNYWNLVAKLDKKVPANLPVYLLTPNQSKYFTGTRPSVSLNLHWQTYTPADSVVTWIENAWFTGNNSIRVIAGNSRPSGTYFTNYIIQSEGDPKSPFTVTVDHGKLAVSLKTAPEKLIPIDTSSLQIAIYSDKYNLDAKYLTAALQSVSAFTKRKTVIKQYSDPGQIPAGQSWLFWMSDKSIGTTDVEKATRVLNYQPGNEVNVSSSIKTNGPFYLTDNEAKTALYKLIKKDPLTDAQFIWVDGYGSPVLSRQQTNKTTQYQFYSHFNPAWNDLVWDDGFPKLLLNLISYNTDNELVKQHDLTVIDHQQLMPDIISEAKKLNDSKVTERVDLTHLFWLVLVAVFLVERWLAHKNRLEVKHG